MATSIQRPSIHDDLRCDPGVVEAANRMDRLDSVIGEDALTGLRAVLRTLVSAVPPDGSTAVSLELWVASPQAVQASPPATRATTRALMTRVMAKRSSHVDVECV